MSHLAEWVTRGKMGHTLKRMGHTWKKESHVKKWATLVKNGPHLEKWVTRRKMGHNCKNVSHVEKCVTLKKIKCVIGKTRIVLVKIGQTWKNGSHLLNGSELHK